jgi:phosphotransferase system HPr-like phosphotransfer protein
MLLAASQGTEVEFEIDGRDETVANDSLCELVNDYFGEGE